MSVDKVLQSTMRAVTLQKRQLVVTFTILRDGLGTSGDADEVELRGHRVKCHILQTGMEAGTSASLQISGLSLDIMNRLSIVQRAPATVSGNMVAVAVEDQEKRRVEVFKGGISLAAADFSGSPNIGFRVEASSSYVAAARPITATSFKGSVSATDVYRTIAGKSGLALRDHGVMSVVSNPNLPGTAAQQIALLSYAVRAVYHIGSDVLDIWPEESQTQEDEALYVSSDSGMIGTPSFSASGIAVNTLFDHRLQFYGTIHIKSPYLPALGVKTAAKLKAAVDQTWLPYNGVWRINRLTHVLEAETPGGAWRSHIAASALTF